MTFNQVRFSLFGIFLAFLMIQLGAVFAVSAAMWPEESRDLASKLLAAYSVPLGVVLGGIAAKPKARMEAPNTALAWAAILLTLLWNVLLSWRSIAFAVSSQDSVSDLLKYIDAISGGSSFLVAGVLAFFFGKGTEAT